MNTFYNTDKVKRLLMSAFAGITVFLFFLLIQPYHLRFQELYQMFLFSSEYFINTVSVPGGFADWTGRLLTQFMAVPWIGALIVSLLFTAVQRLTFKHSARKDPLGYAICFIPAMLLAVSFCNMNTLLSVFTSAIIGLALSEIKGKRPIVTIVVSAALYFLCGTLGTVFYLAVQRKPSMTVYGLATVLLAVIASRYTFHFPISRLICGVHYSRYHDTFPILPWIAAASVWIIFLIFRENRTAKTIFPIISYAIILVSFAFGLFSSRESDWEEMICYSTLAQESQWDRIIEKAQKKAPSSPISISCMNLALAKTGQLGNAMFHFNQAGPDGLFYPYRREHISPIPSSVIYWNLGFMNTCQRFTFAAEEVIPDYQKSSRCHKRLVEVYLVKGQYDIARKYLEPLKYTLFYRHWALETQKLLDNPELIDNHPVYSSKRKLDLKEHSSLFSLQDMYTPLHQYCIENPNDIVLWQYLLGWCLLNNDLDRFVEYLKPEIFKTLPLSYQEAYILYWSRDHESPAGIPSFVSERTINNFMSFTTAAMTMPEERLKAKYSNTYWYYFITHDNGQN